MKNDSQTNLRGFFLANFVSQCVNYIQIHVQEEVDTEYIYRIQPTIHTVCTTRYERQQLQRFVVCGWLDRYQFEERKAESSSIYARMLAVGSEYRRNEPGKQTILEIRQIRLQVVDLIRNLESNSHLSAIDQDAIQGRQYSVKLFF